MNLYDKINETAAFIRQRVGQPRTGIILGSGLHTLSKQINVDVAIAYQDIPHFPVATVEGHAGQLLFGTLGGVSVMMMAGRFHFYEGYNMQEITFPVRVMKALGVDTLIVSNAAGGMNAQYNIGDIVAIRDHINLFPEHPLRGANDERLGPRFPDMMEPYSKDLLQLAQTIAAEQQLTLHSGVYAGLSGPTFETPAEYGWLRGMGADLVGMSTVPEVIVALHSGMRVFAASIVTDLGIAENPTPVTHQEVLEAANAAAPKLAALVSALVSRM